MYIVSVKNQVNNKQNIRISERGCALLTAILPHNGIITGEHLINKKSIML